MKLIINIILLIIVAMCIWHGYKRGLVGGVFGVLAVIIALFGGSFLSARYSHEVIPVLEPFVNGYVDSQTNRDAALEKMGYAGTEYSLEDVIAQDSSLRYDYAYETMVGLGFYEKRAEELAVKSVDYAESTGINMTDSVIAVLCDTITYVGGLVLAFLLILILLIAISNIGNLQFRLPNMPLLDHIGGGVLGLLKSIMYCTLLCWLLSFLGIVIGADTLENTALAKLFLSFRFLTNGLL